MEWYWYWFFAGFLGHIIGYFGTYKLYWRKHYNKELDNISQFVIMIITLPFGGLALLFSLMMFIAHYDDLWKQNQ